ncbi:YbaB/EbfC family nucleoid-associated protein [Amycolatopsis sp. DG1A-15b]|uniref:YbaB/EbfC family nucleoid-associated protein n=1 Tax=Amycolatopsis sp. DG1A-15b TaxID=3052846 RepID=UPI00255BDDE5|nr:YbaB/EbfC family nucleoid-associated protein [Amycolatopsis sp. DG1A-15b]WIX85290.1 YbaB/EbfC family nucleoid-associated protein [Amycolatopsis sp. DG1A-15b]
MTQSMPSGGDPLAAFTVELEEIRAKAAAAQEKLRSAVATVRSPDGAVTVTVGPSGVLQDLRFGPRAYERSPQTLSGLVLQLIGRAQQKVSAEVADAFSGMVGENSAARELLDEFLPEPEPDAGGASAPRQAPEEPPAPPQHRPQPGPQQPQRGQPRRRPRQAPEEDDGESNPW